MCGFNYRRVPAVALMRQLVAAGRLGTIRHVRAVYLQDWIVDPQFPLVWRLRRERGRLRRARRHRRAHHRPDPVRHRPADHRGQRADRDVRQGAAAAGRRRAAWRASDGNGGEPDRGRVTVDDAALFLARLDGGAIATYEATRFATGRKNGLRVEINGSLGSLAFDLERLNELEFYDADGARRRAGLHPDPGDRGATTRTCRRGGRPGHLIGYEHSFTHEMRDLIEAIATGADPTPSFEDALQVQLVLDAVERSAKTGSLDRGRTVAVPGARAA